MANKLLPIENHIGKVQTIEFKVQSSKIFIHTFGLQDYIIIAISSV